LATPQCPRFIRGTSSRHPDNNPRLLDLLNSNQHYGLHRSKVHQ